MKCFQYKAIVIEDKGHLDDPEFLAGLNESGIAEGRIKCPRCEGDGHAVASGWKHREDQSKGAHNQVVLLEREVEVDYSKCADA